MRDVEKHSDLCNLKFESKLIVFEVYMRYFDTK